MSPATRKLRSGATYSILSACAQDNSRVAKRKSPVSKAPLATPEHISTRKFRWTEKRDRTLLIHLIGLDDTISDNEYAKLAMLWDGATADDVHARVEFLRVQQVLTIRTEEPAATAATALMVAVDAAPISTTDDNKPAINEDDITSDISSPLSSPPSSLHSPTPTPSPPSSPHLASPASDEKEDDNEVVPATPTPQLKSALKSRTTTGPGKAVRFPAVIATVRAYSPRPNHHLNKKHDFLWPTERPRPWIPTANASWEDELFDADDAASTDSNHPETSPSPPTERSSSKRTHADFSADSSPPDDTVPRGRPTRRVHAASPSPSVSRTRSASRLTASHRHHITTPTHLPRRFNNHLSAFPKPVRAVAAVCASAAWLDESDDEEETRRVRKKRRYEYRDGEAGFDASDRGWIDWAGERAGEVETVVADEGWFDEGEKEKGGVWVWEEEGEGEGEDEEEEEREEEDAPVVTPTQPIDDTCGGVFDEVDDIEQFERDCDEELGWDPSKELSNSADNDDSGEWGGKEEEY